MTARALTYAVPVEPARAAEVRAALDGLAARPDAARTLFGTGDVHFASITLFDAPDPQDPLLAGACDLPPVLVFEQYVDDAIEPAAYADRLARRDPGTLHALLGCCAGYGPAGEPDPRRIAAHLRRHAVRPMVHFAGNPRADCARVRRELAFRRLLRMTLAKRWSAVPPHVRGNMALHAIAWRAAGARVHEPHARPPRLARARLGVQRLLTLHLLAALAVLALPLLAVAAVLLLLQERRDRSLSPDDLDPSHVRRLADLEDVGGQNHLASVIVVKPGALRAFALRNALRLTRVIAASAPEGRLNGIASIHHAQWALLDGGRRLLFLTNYDGSWGGYLDDFVRLAAAGLTAIWSNVVGFPRTRLLVFGGARDGRAFKAYVRRRQTAAALRYSDYPTLTVQQIAANCRLREGLARRPAGAAALGEWTRLC